MLAWIGVSGWLLVAGTSPEASDTSIEVGMELPAEEARRFKKLRLLATGTPLVGLAALASVGWDEGCLSASSCSALQRAWPMTVGGISLGAGVTMLVTSAFSLSEKGLYSELASRVGPVTRITPLGTRTFGFALAF